MSKNTELKKQIEKKSKIVISLKEELGKVIVGQKDVIEKTIISVL
jgi:hypothetical protein